MLRIGLTGGIGAGKSAVAQLLSAHGAVIIDVDLLAREVVAAGTDGLRLVVDAFGSDILAADGSLDRARLGRRVFADPDVRSRLNAIVHPLVAQRGAALMAAQPAGAVVVHDVPLLVENDLAGGYDLVIVVEAAESTRIERLRRRGSAEDDARARMAAQATDAQRRAVADVVLRNDGDEAELAHVVDTAWRDRIAPLAASGQASPM